MPLDLLVLFTLAPVCGGLAATVGSIHITWPMAIVFWVILRRIDPVARDPRA